jgi:hypothetical protein
MLQPYRDLPGKFGFVPLAIVRPIRLALFIVGISIDSSAGQPATPAYQGPIKTLAQCPFAAGDRAPVAVLPKAKLQAFFACVAKYNSDMTMAQAASWIEDWHQAASCIYYCDAEGIRNIAHVSLWRGLRYIIAQSLPLDRDVDEGCRRAQLSVTVALDEGVNDLVGYRNHTSETYVCATRKSKEQIEESLKRIKGYQEQLYQQMDAFGRAGR